MHIRRLINHLVSSTGYELGKLPDHPGRDYLADVRDLMGEPTVLFDVGANEGQTLEEFARAFPRAQIHCFEPFPQAFATLEAKAGGRAGTSVNRFALGARRADAELFVNVNSATNSLLAAGPEAEEFCDPPSAIRAQGRVTVAVRTVEDYCGEKEIDSIDLLKVDTQGFEMNVLEGAEKLFEAKRIKSVFLELNWVPYYQGQARPGDILNWMARFDYRLVGFYHAHYQENRFLKWCDGLFIAG